MVAKWSNGDDRPRPVKDPAPIGGPAPTRHNRSEVPSWQTWTLGVFLFILIGVPALILWAKLILWMLGL